MKKLLLLPVVLILSTLLSAVSVSATPPVLAVGKAEKIQYNLSGEIYGPFGSGNMLLSISGSIVGAPDAEYEFYNMPEMGTISKFFKVAEEEWVDERGGKWKGKWKRETYCDYYEEFTGTVSSYYNALWYSPLPTFSGRLDATWWDGSTTTFRVQLDPYQIQKGTRYGTRDVSYATETYSYWYFKWDEDSGLWLFQWSEEDRPIILDAFSYSYVESWLYIDFSGMIQSEGTAPLHGTFHIGDSVWEQDGSEERSFYASGTFGPYDLWI